MYIFFRDEGECVCVYVCMYLYICFIFWGQFSIYSMIGASNVVQIRRSHTYEQKMSNPASTKLHFECQQIRHSRVVG